jgi:autotransporter-associated beta strand protein
VISGASSVVSIDDDVKLLIRSTSGNQITFNTSGLIKATGTKGVLVFPTKTSAMNITVPLNEVGTISAGFLQTANNSGEGNKINKLGAGKLVLSGNVVLVGDANVAFDAGFTVEGGGELEVDGTLKAASTFQSGRGNFDSKVGATSGNNILRVAGPLGNTFIFGSLFVGEDPTGNNQVIISRPGNGNIFGQASFLMWGNGEQLRLGVASSNNSLTVSNGAVFAQDGGGGTNTWFMGVNAGANNNTLLVTGSGSTINFGSNQAMQVGAAGSSNKAIISAGGIFNTRRWIIGANGGDDNSVTITGAGSRSSTVVSSTNSLFEIGSIAGSNGNSMSIEAGGAYTFLGSGTTRNFSVGKVGAANNNFLRITGVGSSLNVDFALPIVVGGIATGTTFTDAGVTSLGNHLDIFSGGNATTNSSIYLGGGTTGAGNQTALNLGDGNGLSVLSVGASAGFTSGIFFSGTAGTQQQLNFNNGKLIATVNGTLVSGSTGSIILNGPATISQSGTSTQSNTITASITGGAGGSFTKEGAGVLVLNAANTYAGQTIASQGILEFQNTSALYNADASKWTKANITVNSGGTLGFAVGGAGQFVANDIATFLDAAHLGASDASAGLLSGGSIGFNTAGGNFSTSIVISNPNNGANALGVVKYGANTLTLTGVNSYTGPTKISAGTLSVGEDANLGGTNSLILDGGTLQITGNTLNNLSQHTPVAVAAKTVTIDIADASNIFTVSQALNQTTGGLIKLGLGTLVLGDANTFTGATTISNGVLSINSIQNAGSSNANALGNPAVGAGSIIGLAASGTLQFTGSANGASDRVISLSTPAGGTFTLDASGSETFALSGGITSAGTSGTSTLILTGSGNGSESGIIANGTGANTTAVTKNGSGTWTLGGGNTYSGDTSVNGGTLVVGGFIVGSTAVNAGTLVVNGTISGSTSVSSGGTLAGSNGTLGNVTVESSGTFSPGGNGTGSLTVNGGLELKASSNFSVQFDTDGGFVDAITINGNLTIVTGAVFNVNDIGSAPDGFLNFQNDIITYSGTWNGGTFLGLQDDSIFTSEGITYLISYNDNDINGLGLHAVTLTIVPEPGAAVTLLGGLGILLGVRRRRACSNLHGKPRVL